MKILHVYRTYFPDPPGGLQEAIRQICLATKAEGYESKIFTLSPTPFPRIIKNPEGEVVRCHSWCAPASCDIGALEAFVEFKKLTQWADIVHYHFPWPFADILHFFNGISKPAVMTYHSDIVRQRLIGKLYAPLMKKMLHSMKAVVATSPAYAETSPVLRNNVSPEQLRVIPLGIVEEKSSIQQYDLSIVERLSLKKNGYFLALGALRYYKGLHTLIEAASSVNATIVIAGAGPEEASLKQLAVRATASNIIFTGAVLSQEKLALLRQCRALVLPSHLRSEAFGMVLLEASMCSKPMVCCEMGSGTSFVNQHGVTGFVVPPESPVQLAQAMNYLLQDETLANQMGQAARRRYEKLFSGPVLGKNYVQLYQEMLR